MKHSSKVIIQLFFTVLFPLIIFCQTEILPMRNHPQYQSVFGSRSGYVVSLNNYGPEHALGKVGSDSWASGGTGVVEEGGSGAMFTNPACMDFRSLTISAEVSTRLKTKAYYDFNYDDQYYPSFVSIGIRKEGWNISAGYFKYYTYKTLDNLVETTPAFPEGTGNYTTHERLSFVHTLFGSVSNSSEKFSYGLTLGINYLYSNSSSWGESVSGFGVMAVAGVLAKPNEKFNIGFSLKYVTPIEYKAQPINEEYLYCAVFPWQVEFGLSNEISKNLRILTSVDFQNWREVSEINNNVLQFHLGAIYSVDDCNKIRLGFFTQNDPSQYLGKYFNQNFITGGFQTGDKNVTLTLSILDSHLFSGEEFRSASENKNVQFHQTIISLGGTYKFE